MSIIITIGLTIALLDMLCTLGGRPLLGPGPLAKFLYPGLKQTNRRDK